MLGRKEWRVRTRFREIVLRVPAAGSPAPQSAESAGSRDLILADLMFELDAGNAEVARALGEIGREIDGAYAPIGLRGDDLQPDQLRGALRAATAAGLLRIDPVSPPRLPEGLVDPEAGDAGGPDGAADDGPGENTFIGIDVRDAGDRPVPGRRFRIKMPDGEVHEGFTGANGKWRADGLLRSGTATVTFPTAGGSGRPPRNAEDDAVGTIDLLIVDEAGTPLPGIAFRLTLADGAVHTGKAGDDGAARVPRLAAGACTLELPELDGREWQLEDEESEPAEEAAGG